MFGPDFFIDTFQDTKRIVTNQIFKDPTLNKAATALARMGNYEAAKHIMTEK